MILARVIGAESVIAHLDAMPPRIIDAMRADVSRLTIGLLRKVKAEKLSGQVLKNRTGTLRARTTYAVESTPQSVTGKVGTKLSYAAAHEYGFQGPVTVREHLRTVRQAWGRALREPVRAVVRAHTRTMNLPERSFLRSSLAEMAPEISAGLEAAVRKAVTK